MDCQITAFWMSIGIAAAALFCGGLALGALVSYSRATMTAIWE